MKTPRFLFTTFLLFALYTVVPAFAEPQDHPRPGFDKTSDASVRLRYLFPEGGETPFSLSFSMVQGEGDPSTAARATSVVNVTGRYRTLQTPVDGTATVEYVISRITATAGGAQPQTFDSAGEEEPPAAMAPFRLAVNQPLLVRVGSDGAIREIDSGAVTRALQDAGRGDAAAGVVSFIELLPTFTFIPLPDGPFRAGDIHAATSKKGAGSATDISTIFGSFRLVAVASDKKRALIEPIVTFDYSGADFGDSSVTAWLVFDLEEGAVSDLYVYTHLNVSYDSLSPEMRMRLDMEAIYARLF